MDLKQLFVAVGIVFFLLAVTKQNNASEASTDQAHIVFTCMQSPDGICYTTGENLSPCYTSGGTSFGECKLNDTVYPKQDPTVCKANDGNCPRVVEQPAASSVLAQAPELYSFSFEEGLEYYEGFCLNERCYTYSGSPIDIHDTLMLHRDKMQRCYPALDDQCPATSSMVTVVVREYAGEIRDQING